MEWSTWSSTGPRCDRQDAGRSWSGVTSSTPRSLPGATVKTPGEADPAWRLQHRDLDVVLPEVVGRFDNLRPQGPPWPRTTARSLPTSGSSPIQVQADPQGLDGWGSGINVLYASTLDDMGIPSTGEARTNLNSDVSCANHLSPTHDRYKFTVWR
jgi:hypothetical protein